MPRAISVLLTVLFMAPAMPSISIAQETGPPIPGEFEIPMEEVVLIRSPEDESVRLLMTFPGLDQLQGKLIYAARLLVPPLTISQDIYLQPFLITTPWDPHTADWHSPWVEPGGDYIRHPRPIRHLPAFGVSEDPLWLDVTDHVSTIAQGDQPNYGIIIKPPDEIGLGYAPLLAPALESLSNIVIVGHYRVLED